METRYIAVAALAVDPKLVSAAATSPQVSGLYGLVAGVESVDLMLYGAGAVLMAALVWRVRQAGIGTSIRSMRTWSMLVMVIALNVAPTLLAVDRNPFSGPPQIPYDWA